MQNYLSIAQIITALLLMAGVLLQQRGGGLGSAFGGGGEGRFYGTLRGAQKKIFWATIVFAAIFIILAILDIAL